MSFISTLYKKNLQVHFHHDPRGCFHDCLYGRLIADNIIFDNAITFQDVLLFPN